MKTDPIRRYPQLSRRGERILLALLEHPTQEKAAAAGISTVTLWRWQKKPGFQRALAEARRDVYSQAMARIHQASGAAAATLVRVMVEPGTPHASRIRAATAILDNGARSLERDDFETRLRELERSAFDKAPGKVIRKLATFGEQQEVRPNEVDQEGRADNETDLKAA
jgi:hypothetical protein